jgi:hypothetical protein
MRVQRRQFLRLATASALISVAPRIAGAQTYPERPVRMVVPYAPGGPTDVVTRIIAQYLSDRVGRQFFVENIGGGGGNIAMGRVAKSAPDGYTLLMVNPSYVVNPTLYNEIPYRFEKDFDPGLARRADDLGDRGASVGSGPEPQGACRGHQVQSGEIQLCLAGNRNTGTSRRRNLSPVAWP